MILWQNRNNRYHLIELSLINSKFNELRKKKRLALMPFLMAGDPNLEITSEILFTLQDQGADLIELGIPYSDPLADGPIIQLSASRALQSGTSLAQVLDLLKTLKGKLNTPVILFTYFNPLLSFGFKRFCEIASDVGAAGIIIPAAPTSEAISQNLLKPKLSKGLKYVKSIIGVFNLPFKVFNKSRTCANEVPD